MYKILIVGCGVVGSNIKNKLSRLNPDIVDKYKPELTNYDSTIEYDFAYICVDTPFNENNNCDISEVINAINEYNSRIYIIKSTILPGTTEKLIKDTNKSIVFSPEFYGGTQHCNNFEFNYTILGGNKSDCIKVQQMLQEVFDARHIFRITDSKTAELVKYMENSYLATKVSLCSAFYSIANNIGVSYEDLRELFILDPRINSSHTFINRSKPYWDSHCLNKDVRAIAEFSNNEFLKNIIEYNNICKYRR